MLPGFGNHTYSRLQKVWAKDLKILQYKYMHAGGQNKRQFVSQSQFLKVHKNHTNSSAATLFASTSNAFSHVVALLCTFPNILFTLIHSYRSSQIDVVRAAVMCCSVQQHNFFLRTESSLREIAKKKGRKYWVVKRKKKKSVGKTNPYVLIMQHTLFMLFRTNTSSSSIYSVGLT